MSDGSSIDGDFMMTAATWLVLNAALPITSVFPETAARKRLLFGIGVIISTIATVPIAWAGRMTHTDSLWLAAIVLFSALLPASLVAMVTSCRKTIRIFSPYISIPTGLLICLALPVLALGYEKAVALRPDEWVRPVADLRVAIAELAKAQAEDDFTIAAANGKFTRAPDSPDELGKLGLWIFTQRCGLSLQPGLRVVGAQAVVVTPSADTVEIVATPDTHGRFICRVTAVADLSYHLRWSPADGTPSERKWGEQAVFKLEGLFDPASRTFALVSAMPTDASQANTPSL